MNIKVSRKIKRALIMGGIFGALVGILLTFAAANKALEKKELSMAKTESTLKRENKELQTELKQQTAVEAAANLSSTGTEDWATVLVNAEHPLDQAYQPELAEVSAERNVDARIVEDAKEMIADAEAGGLKMNVCSAYRSYDDQKVVFEETMQNWLNQGSGYVDAYNQTKQSVAVPGFSEHALGLALDITSQEYQELDDKQAETAEAKWLAENCYKYGFILRYPTDKSDITGIVYEPWHYRYVGKEVAKEITEKGITFEEYLNVK